MTVDDRSSTAPAGAVGRFLPPAPIGWALVAQTFTTTVGAGMFIAGSALFFTRYLGLSAGQVSLGISVAFFVSMLANVPLGILADRIGGREAWLLAVVVQAVTLALYPLARSFLLFVLVVTVEAVAAALNGVGRAKYMGDLLPEGSQVRGSAYLRSVAQAGMAVGAVVAGVLVSIGTTTTYLAFVWVDAATFALDAVLIATVVTAVPEDRRRRRERSSARRVHRDRPFVVLVATMTILNTRAPLLTVVVPLWIVLRTDAPAWAIPSVLVLNMVAVILLQVAASTGADSVDGALRAQRRAGWAVAAACVVLAGSQTTRGIATVAVLMLGVLLLTIGEILAAAASWGLAYHVAPAPRRGEYLAVLGLGNQLSWAVGPAALSAVVIGATPIGWFLASGAFLLGAAASTPAGNRVKRTARLGPATRNVDDDA